MKSKFGRCRRKGQSAIEYLMTYGWMLLVVAIVGGAIFATVQSNQSSCEKEIIDIKSTQQGFGISDFTVTSSDLNIELENNQRDTVEVSSITLEAGSNLLSSNRSLSFGETTTVSTTSYSSADSCSEINVTIDYSQGGLPAQVTGTLKAKMG